MIEVEHLTKNYGPRSAIINLSFQINQGEVVGFLGPNGAGKSTTMNIPSCILPATEGKARVCGFDTFDQSLEIRKVIGYLPETPPLYQDMVVSKFLEFSAGLRHVPKKKIAAAVDRVLERCGLGDVRHRIIGRLSKGYQQRVGLAQAMIHDPKILILDEPTIGLDPIQIIEIRKLIQELGTAHTILLSSHILPEVTQICHASSSLMREKLLPWIRWTVSTRPCAIPAGWNSRCVTRPTAFKANWRDCTRCSRCKRAGRTFLLSKANRTCNCRMRWPVLRWTSNGASKN